jgi:exosortase
VERNRFINRVRLSIPFLICFGVLAVLVAPTLESVGSRWLKFDESYSHGFLLLAVVVFITARKWWAEPPVAGFYPLWFFPFLLTLSGYAIGGFLRVEAVQELVLIPLILSVLAILIGWNQGRKFILPITILLFAMPFWDYLSWTLQLITVAVNEFGLGLLGIDFRIDGVFVFLTGVGAFEVAHGCSGLRYLLVGQSLALLYGELNLTAIRSRVILFVAAVGLALFANWVRVFVIIYMGYETNMQSSLIEDHDNFGWWVFAATLVPLFLLGRRLEKTAAEQIAERGVDTSGPASAGASTLRVVSVFTITICLLVVMVALPSNQGDIRPDPETYSLRLDGDYYGPVFSSGLDGWRPQIANPDRVYQQTLFDRSDVTPEAGQLPRIFYVSVHTYEFQRQGAEVIQYFNRNYDSDEWRPEDIFTLVSAKGRELSGVTLQHRRSGKQVHLAYGYYVEGIWESDQLRAKLSQLGGLFNQRTDASQVTFGVSCDDTCVGKVALQPLVERVLPELLSAIDDKYQR